MRVPTRAVFLLILSAALVAAASGCTKKPTTEGPVRVSQTPHGPVLVTTAPPVETPTASTSHDANAGTARPSSGTPASVSLTATASQSVSVFAVPSATGGARPTTAASAKATGAQVQGMKGVDGAVPRQFGEWTLASGPVDSALGEQYRYRGESGATLQAVISPVAYDAGLISQRVTSMVPAGQGTCGVEVQTGQPCCLLPLAGGSLAVFARSSAGAYAPTDIYPHAQALYDAMK